MSEVAPVVLAAYDQVLNTPNSDVTISVFVWHQKVAALSPLSLHSRFIPSSIHPKKKGGEMRGEFVKMETALLTAVVVLS